MTDTPTEVSAPVPWAAALPEHLQTDVRVAQIQVQAHAMALAIGLGALLKHNTTGMIRVEDVRPMLEVFEASDAKYMAAVRAQDVAS